MFATLKSLQNQVLYPSALLCCGGFLPLSAVTAQTITGETLFDDTKQYVSAPLRWDQHDWWFAGGTLAAVLAAHHYDEQVRDHFVTPQNVIDGEVHSRRDWLPTVGVVAATWGLAWWSDDRVGERETTAMVEAGAFSAVTAVLAKQLVGHVRPDHSADANQWFKGGDSFPSTHVSVAFAVGTVLAESGNDELRWVRRALGYGLGIGTAYVRMQGNAHWLSDCVAGAALGNATARFVMHRRYPAQANAGQWQLLPDGQGVRLSYNVAFQ
jgi:membrane-associated phospholipid phosphatase